MAAGASADKKIYVMELNSGTTMTLEGHDAPVRTVRFGDIPSANAPIIASGSWDKTVRYWDLRQPTPIGSLQLPERVYAMDAAGPLLVAATADNSQVHLVNLHANPLELWKTVKSPLSNQPRSVAVSADGSRWAISGIDGRAAAQATDEKKDRYDLFPHLPPSPGINRLTSNPPQLPQPLVQMPPHVQDQIPNRRLRRARRVLLPRTLAQERRTCHGRV
jgi:mRNA export factor